MEMSDINIHFFRMINDLGKQYTYLNPFMVFVAEYTVIFLALGVLIWWFARSHKEKIMVICASATFVVSEVLGKVAGKIHSNSQPFAELSSVNQLIEKAVDNSFPSDHTILFFSFCVTFFLFRRGWGLMWIALAFLVGFSRIWVGVHYPADIIVGAIISITSAFIVYRVVPKSILVSKILGIYEKYERYILPIRTKSKRVQLEKMNGYK